MVWIGLGLAAVVAALAVFWLRRKPRPVPVSGPSSSAEPQPVTVAGSESRRKQLLQDMADLDNDFEAGQIAREPYERLRSRMKSDLVNMMQARPKDAVKRGRR